jgi:fructose-specific component phosphotransferase system IIB-like protein
LLLLLGSTIAADQKLVGFNVFTVRSAITAY